MTPLNERASPSAPPDLPQVAQIPPPAPASLLPSPPSFSVSSADDETDEGEDETELGEEQEGDNGAEKPDVEDGSMVEDHDRDSDSDDEADDDKTDNKEHQKEELSDNNKNDGVNEVSEEDEEIYDNEENENGKSSSSETSPSPPPGARISKRKYHAAPRSCGKLMDDPLYLPGRGIKVAKGQSPWAEAFAIPKADGVYGIVRRGRDEDEDEDGEGEDSEDGEDGEDEDEDEDEDKIHAAKAISTDDIDKGEENPAHEETKLRAVRRKGAATEEDRNCTHENMMRDGLNGNNRGQKYKRA
ncbi:MAG: hypothetical protein Q9168_006421 [Polycauliona sp. 1 TL-2023]